MKFLLDNCIVYKLCKDNKTMCLLKEFKEFTLCEFFVGSAVIKEIIKTQDDAKEQHITMLDKLFSLEPHILNDDRTIFDKTELNFLSLPDYEVYDKILEINENAIHEAIFGQLAVTNHLILITEDEDLYRIFNSLEYDVFKLIDLYDGKKLIKEKYPILKHEYKNGYVCYFDILGFSLFSLREENLKKIQNMVYDLQVFFKQHCLNRFIGKITMFSDSVFFTIEDTELKDYMFFTSIIDFVCVARNIIQHYIKTDIRAGVSYGKYIHLNSGEIYGPAIIQSVKLGEPKKDDSPLSKYLDGDPAAIILHENILCSPANEHDSLRWNFQQHPERYEKIEGTNFYSVNPYYFIYDTLNTIISIDKKQICNQWRQIIDNNKEHKDKYELMESFLNEFENDSKIK